MTLSLTTLFYANRSKNHETQTTRRRSKNRLKPYCYFIIFSRTNLVLFPFKNFVRKIIIDIRAIYITMPSVCHTTRSACRRRRVSVPRDAQTAPRHDLSVLFFFSHRFRVHVCVSLCVCVCIRNKFAQRTRTRRGYLSNIII